MLKWKEEIIGVHKTLETSISGVSILCHDFYRFNDPHFEVYTTKDGFDSYIFTSDDFESLEECKEGAEQWLKDFFSPIIETARDYFLNTMESEWSIEEVLKHYNNDQQERHTGSNIRGADIREVPTCEMKREEEV